MVTIAAAVGDSCQGFTGNADFEPQSCDVRHISLILIVSEHLEQGGFAVVGSAGRRGGLGMP